MSNPGVITLIQKKINGGKNFRIEDNLGESIHIHYTNFRIDLTVTELLELAEICDKSIYDLIPVSGFDLDDYDGDFLVEYSKELYDLIEVKKEKIPVSELHYLTKNKLNIPIRKHIRSLNGNKNENKIDKDHLPVVFNNGNTLVYGAPLANEIYSSNSNEEIEIIRLYFEGEKYSITNHPWVPFFFLWDKGRIKKTAKKIYFSL